MHIEHRLNALERHGAQANAEASRCRVDLVKTDIAAPAGWEALRRAGHPLVDDDQLPPSTWCSTCGRHPERILSLRAPSGETYTPDRWYGVA